MKHSQPACVFLIAMASVAPALSACRGGQPTAATPSQPILPTTIAPPTETEAEKESTPAPAGKSKPAHLISQWDLSGTAPVKGSFAMDLSNLGCGTDSFKAMFAAPITKIEGTEAKFAVPPAAMVALRPGGTISLTKEYDVVVSVGEWNFWNTRRSSATLTWNKDGSGTLTVKNLTGTKVAESKTGQESGTISWSCQ